MTIVTIPTPPLTAVQRFCSDHAVSPTALFKLSWGLIQHCYFGTDAFLFDEENKDSKHNGKARGLISFLPELASKCTAIMTLRQDGMHKPDQDTVLLHRTVNDFDDTFQKICSRLRFSWTGCGAQDHDENMVQGDRAVRRFMGTLETPG